MVCLSLPAIQVAAQQQVSPSPAQEPSASTSAEPAIAPVFSKPDPANFTALAPTKEVVNAFLEATWGYDESRVWLVQAILKTPVEGISKVVVLAGDKSGKKKIGQLQFFVLPDGKHILANGDIVAFGEHPYAEERAILQQRADGPYRGSAAKDLELIEFADLQCPLCKEEQANMDKLAADFPKARIVFQNLSLEHIHLAAAKAAAYGVCVNKEGGSNAFFQFASTVFEGQAELATADGATLTLNSAVSKASLDPAKIAACAATPETKTVVNASVKLAKDLSIGQVPGQVPTLVINGRPVPMGGVPYETLKQIVAYQAKLDGVAD
jgi:protein-disulfide isomerase